VDELAWSQGVQDEFAWSHGFSRGAPGVQVNPLNPLVNLILPDSPYPT
jgi:hypothetical protein